MKTHKEWERFWKESGTRPDEPRKYVIDMVPFFRKRRVRTVLDFGCGKGRHTVYLARLGFVVVGQDISPTGLQMARHWLDASGTKNAILINHEVTRLPYVDGTFDAVISTNALHHNKLKDINRSVGELHRVLRKKGILFVNLSSRQKQLQKSRRLERGTYLTLEGPEKGMVHHLFTRSEVLRTFSKFKILRLTPPSEQDHHWVLLAEKR